MDKRKHEINIPFNFSLSRAFIIKLTFSWLEIIHDFISSAFFLSPKLTFFKKSFRNTIRVSNSLDPDQARHFVGPDLGTNCLQR